MTDVATQDASLAQAELIVARALGRGTEIDIVEALGETLSVFYPKSGSASTIVTRDDLQKVVDQLPVLLQYFKERVWRSANVTDGAKDLVADTSQIEPAFRIVVTDKAARSVLRLSHGINIGRVVDDSGVVIAPYGVDAEGTIRAAPVGALADLTFGEACEHYDVEFRVLDGGAAQITYKVKGAKKTIKMSAFVELLEAPSQLAQVVEVCNGLWRNSEQFVLITLHAAAQAGHIDVHPENAPQFRVFCIRALMALNAIESAYQEAAALTDDEDAFAMLSEGEQTRLQGLLARAAVRSGRADGVLERFTELFVTEPSAEVFRVLLSVASVKDRQLTLGMCHTALAGAVDLNPKDWIFVGDLFRGYGHPELALGIAQGLIADEKPIADAYVALANVGLAMGNDAMWRAAMLKYFRVQDLPVRYESGHEMRPFGFVPDDDVRFDEHELVTIVMTTFNAAATLEMAVSSVQAQTCTNWELMIVDDVSTDGTREIIERLAALDARITPLFKTVNEGTYLAKNEGMRIANGAFVTFHDSDDWMHPMRIERHLQEMENGAACSTSGWLRMDGDGCAIVRRGGPFVHLNPASTFFRRAALDAVGFFDAVRTGADSEILARVRETFGASSVLSLKDCLGIGLHHDTSLTTSGAAAFDEYRYSPVRVAYWESWLRWHVIRGADGHSLFNPGTQDLPFAVPDGIRP
jgi:hypothetical protein